MHGDSDWLKEAVSKGLTLKIVGIIRPKDGAASFDGAIGYTSYMARLFFFPKMDHYDIYQGITIAAFAFTDLGWAIHGLIREAKNKNIVAAGLK